MAAMPTSVRSRTRELVLGAGPRLPDAAARGLMRRAARDREIALCLHRIGTPRPGTPLPWMTMPPEALDAFLDLARGLRLTLTFDDGYADAVAYVLDRAPRHPDVDFVLFVCPEKIERRAGFRWDLFELRRLAGDDPGPLRAFVDAPIDPARENHRDDLAGLGDRPAFELATVDDCRRAAAIRNVRLGNHGNTHLRLAGLEPAAAAAELVASTRDFARLFGPTEDFAFPFGVPGRDYGRDHVRRLLDLGIRRLWTTEAGVFRPDGGAVDRVLPRFPVMGSWHPKSLAVWVAATALRRGPLDDSVLDQVAAGAAGE